MFPLPSERSLSDLYLPMLELFTEGFLSTRRMLDDYLALRRRPAG